VLNVLGPTNRIEAWGWGDLQLVGFGIGNRIRWERESTYEFH
jgi:hypothetical protein